MSYDKKYLRDEYSNALIRNDKKTLENHRNNLKQKNELYNNSKEINILKKEIVEIKNMLNLILEKMSQE